jgi:hypothetical protein
MKNIKQWNKKLLYSGISLVAAIVVLFGGLVYKIYDLVYYLIPNLRYDLLVSGKSSSIDEAEWNITLALFFIFILLSIFMSIQSMRKTPLIPGKRKIFDLVPQSIYGWLAFAIVFISSILFILILIGMFL